ncbi:MAG: hypothetical protein Q9177_004271, partial [Variospora cf. flavescens]
IHDLETANSGQFEYTDDVHTNSRELCLGRKSGGKIGVGRVEHMGNLLSDRGVARPAARHGRLV